MTDKPKHIMTRAEAIELFKEHMPPEYSKANRIIDFYIAAGMLEIKEEEEKPMFEIKCTDSPLHIRIYSNGEITGINGIVINRIPEFMHDYKYEK